MHWAYGYIKNISFAHPDGTHICFGPWTISNSSSANAQLPRCFCPWLITEMIRLSYFYITTEYTEKQ